MKIFQIVGFAMHTQTWVIPLFTCRIKHDVVLEQAVARNKKLGDMSWNGKKPDVVLEKAVARNKKKNGFLHETFEKMGPANKDSAP